MALNNAKNNTGFILIKATYIGDENFKTGYKPGEEYTLKLFNNSNVFTPTKSGCTVFVAKSISHLLENWENIKTIGKLNKNGKTKN